MEINRIRQEPPDVGIPVTPALVVVNAHRMQELVLYDSCMHAPTSLQQQPL